MHHCVGLMLHVHVLRSKKYLKDIKVCSVETRDIGRHVRVVVNDHGQAVRTRRDVNP